MTREEAIKICNTVLLFGHCECTEKEADEFFKLAMKALAQVTKSEWEQDHAILKAHSDGANEVLDIIKAKIEKCRCDANNEYDQGRNYGLYMATQVIDLYRTAEIYT